MLETRALFVGLRDTLRTWHTHWCHKGDTWAKETSHAKVKIIHFSDRDGSTCAHRCVSNLGEREEEKCVRV